MPLRADIIAGNDPSQIFLQKTGKSLQLIEDKGLS